MVFTPSNWKTDQIITVTGVADSTVDGDQLVDVEVTSASTDAMYGTTIAARKYTHRPVVAEGGTHSIHRCEITYRACAGAVVPGATAMDS